MSKPQRYKRRNETRNRRPGAAQAAGYAAAANRPRHFLICQCDECRSWHKLQADLEKVRIRKPKK